jgi:hypothetical protein
LGNQGESAVVIGVVFEAGLVFAQGGLGDGEGLLQLCDFCFYGLNCELVVGGGLDGGSEGVDLGFYAGD